VADGLLRAGAGVEHVQDLGVAAQPASVNLVLGVRGEEFEYRFVPGFNQS
jgi:hypothetical protein